MAWTPPVSISSGSTVNAADWNTYVLNNISALLPYTGVGQIAYSTSSTTLTTVSLANTGNMFSISTAGIPFAGALIASRQGNLSTDWANLSTSTTFTNYTVANAVMQTGASLVLSSSTLTITYPTAYTYPPLVFAMGLYVKSITSSYFVIQNTSGSDNVVFWLAIGE